MSDRGRGKRPSIMANRTPLSGRKHTALPRHPRELALPTIFSSQWELGLQDQVGIRFDFAPGSCHRPSHLSSAHWPPPFCSLIKTASDGRLQMHQVPGQSRVEISRSPAGRDMGDPRPVRVCAAWVQGTRPRACRRACGWGGTGGRAPTGRRTRTAMGHCGRTQAQGHSELQCP